MATWIRAIKTGNFIRACREHLDEYFATVRHTHRCQVFESAGGLTYTIGKTAFVIEDFCDSWPNTLIIGVGIMRKFGAIRESCIALGNDIPHDDPDAHYWDWRFTNECELRSCLERVRDIVLPRYATPLIENPDVTLALLRRWQNSQDAAVEARRVEALRKQAVMAFKAGLFAEAFRLYAEMSPCDLDPSDSMRINIARTHLFGKNS